ncbi:MAG: amidohydrolase family protein [Prosthecobacter sp.]
MNRRNFLLCSTAALAASKVIAAEENKLTDCHVYLGQSPFRELEAEDAGAFARLLQKRGVTEAWAGAFEGLLRRDVAEVNRALAETCRKHSVFRPCGTVNLALPDWQEDVKRCAEEHGMRVIRLHPNHHGHTLKDAAFKELLALSVKHRLLVQLVAQMEDERTQHPQVRVGPVDLGALPALMKEAPAARVMLLNGNAAMVMRHLQECPNVWLDFAMIEGVGGVENLLKTWPQEKLVFGSYAPVFYWESAKLKMQESALSEAHIKAVTWQNAAGLMA